ncbi:MAG: hypothetical protein WBM59_02550, partial [Sedimenticolaceae bacterium]
SVLVRVALLYVRDNGRPDNIFKSNQFRLRYRTHNPKVVGSNPAPLPKVSNQSNGLESNLWVVLLFSKVIA